MTQAIRLDLAQTDVDESTINKWNDSLKAGKERLWSGEEAFTGWVKLPFEYERQELLRILETAEKIRNQCEVFIVIGIGGSYLGAQAAITCCRVEDKNGPEIYFAGQNISGTYHKELLNQIKDREICICVISKSGTTTESSVAFSILKDLLYQKYGREEAARRIYAITDAKKGVLRAETEREGYTSFVVPDDIGGRYSVLTAVGLLPIAVAGIDVKTMLAGAEEEAKQLKADFSDAEKLAATRVSLLKKGKPIEIYEYYEPRLQYFSEWMKQLFGESEGKNGTGIFPAALQFSTDLHSMGQFLQEGNQIFFETVINLENPPEDLIVPASAGELLAGRSMNGINQAAVEGVIAAHRAVGIPIIRIDITELTPFSFGQMVYFFETTCALSGYLMGVDPFDQPGVESYKSEMRRVLKGEK